MKPLDQTIIKDWLRDIEPSPKGLSDLLATADALYKISRHIDDALGHGQGLEDLEATPRQLRRYRATPDSHSLASASSKPKSNDGFSATINAPSTTPLSTLVDALGTRDAYFPPLDDTASPRTPSPPKRSIWSRQNSSPSKRAKSTTSLGRLQRPVRFKRVQQSELPDDARQLYQQLFAVANKEGILPRVLKSSDGFAETPTRPFMWELEQTDDLQVAQDVHRNIKQLVADSIDCANEHRSEAAWNAMVHFPALRFFLSEFPSVDVELITSAQIAKPFRPLWRDTRADDDASSLSTVSSASSVTSGGTRGGAASLSLHKMVDFALVLLPDPPLAAAINDFLALQPVECDTVNQTTYHLLCLRLALIFIETKTSFGNSEAAKLQLGVWIAGYHERLRNILEQRPVRLGREPIMTLPVVQWYDGTWIVSFAVDTEHGIDVLDVDLQMGGCNSLLGAYQLRKVVACLAVWIESQFKPWVTSLLSRT